MQYMMHIQDYSKIRQDSEGILVVDKPCGVTSHTVVNWARKTFGVRKIGHTGTLDPLASGMLLVLVGRKYTKQQQKYLKLDKEYAVVFELGHATDTYDCSGAEVKRASVSEVMSLSEKRIKDSILSFVGEVEQEVPLYSAVKRKGKKLYELARSNTAGEVVLPIKKVTIYSISDIHIWQNSDSTKRFVSCTILCSSGCYIRSLVNDIGLQLSVGATMTALRRKKIGEFELDSTAICPVIPAKWFRIPVSG